MIPTTYNFEASGPRTGSGSRSLPRVFFVVFVVFALVICAGVAAMAAPAPEFEPEERASALARPALVQLDIHWSGVVEAPAGEGTPFGPSAPVAFSLRCSAFFVGISGLAVTSANCVDPLRARPFFVEQAVLAAALPPVERDALRARLAATGRVTGSRTGADGGDRETTIQWNLALPRESAIDAAKSGPRIEARVLPSGSPAVAVLQVDTTDVPALALAASGEDVRRGRPVVALGYPGEVDKIEAAGTYPVDRWGTVLDTSVSFYEVSAIALGSMKGGPVVDMEGRVIGLSGLGPDGSEESFSVVPAAMIASALGSQGAALGPGPLDRRYRTGLDHFYQGDMRAAITEFENVIEAPARHDAAAFLARARDLQILADQRGTGLPVLFVVFAVVVVGAGVMVIRSRSARRPLHP